MQNYLNKYPIIPTKYCRYVANMVFGRVIPYQI
jgi:hypothetical protein